MANKIKLARGTKSRIESIKSGMLDYELVYSTDTNELGVKKPDGDVNYIGSGGGSGGGNGGVQEAPIDNKLYGRKDETWQEIDLSNYYNKTQLDLMIGDIEGALDLILGV